MTTPPYGFSSHQLTSAYFIGSSSDFASGLIARPRVELPNKKADMIVLGYGIYEPSRSGKREVPSNIEGMDSGAGAPQNLSQ